MLKLKKFYVFKKKLFINYYESNIRLTGDVNANKFFNSYMQALNQNCFLIYPCIQSVSVKRFGIPKRNRVYFDDSKSYSNARSETFFLRVR